MGRKMYVIYAPGGLGYFLVKNTEDAISSHLWHHGSYGLQRARKFYSVDNAQAIIRQGFRDAGGHPARVAEVKVRMSYYVTTEGSDKTYWLCPDYQFPDSPRWKASDGAKYNVMWFRNQQAASAAAARVRVPQDGGKTKVVKSLETYLVG